MRLAFFALTWLALVASACAGDHWPQFRGPTGDGVSDAKGLPVSFGEKENVRWKTAIHGKGWSSPVVWGDQIWLTTATADGKQLFAMCVDLNSGQIKHDLKLWDIESPQFCHEFNSYASPTPVIEAGRVYVHFGSPGTAAIDTATGKVVWERRDLPCNHFRGAGSSPILFGDLLILTFDGFDYNYLVALDKRTGDTVWRRDRNISYKTDNGDYHKAYSTPQVIDVAGQKQLISPSAEATIAYDPAKGDEIWRVITGGMNAANRPIYGNGLVYSIAPDGGFRLFAVKPEGKGDITGTHVVWKSSRGIPSRPSPILIGDRLFMVGNDGVMTCLNAISSDLMGQKRYGGKFSASPVLADGRMYFFSEEGAAPVTDTSPEFKVLAENKLDAGCMASPAVVGRSLIVRTKTHLYRLETSP